MAPMVELFLILVTVKFSTSQTPQPNVVSDDRNHGLFMWIHLKKDSDVRRALHDMGDIQLMTESICPQEECKYADRIIAGVGFGETLLKQIAPSGYPGSFPHIARACDIGEMPNTGGDIFIHAKSASKSNLFELSLKITNRLQPHLDTAQDVYGFKFKGGRDLSDFADGTKNPKGNDVEDVALIKENGGTFCVTQKWVHDLKLINKLSVNVMESFFGRTKESDIELTNKTDTAHLSRMRSGPELDAHVPFQIYRQSMPFGNVNVEAGLFFIAFANSTKNFDFMLDRMFGQTSDGHADDILRFSQCVSSSYWYFPSTEQLRSIIPIPM